MYYAVHTMLSLFKIIQYGLNVLSGKSSFKFLLFAVYLIYSINRTNNPLRTNNSNMSFQPKNSSEPIVMQYILVISKNMAKHVPCSVCNLCNKLLVLTLYILLYYQNPLYVYVRNLTTLVEFY